MIHAPFESWLDLGAKKNTRLVHSAKYMKQSSVVTIDLRRHIIVFDNSPTHGCVFRSAEVL